MKDVREQALAADETVLVVKQLDRAAIGVRGKDAVRWLNGLVTCDLAILKPGQAAYGLLVEKKGRIQTDLFVVPTWPAAPLEGPDLSVTLAVPSALRDGLVPNLDHYLIMEDAELDTPELAFYMAHGPKASSLLLELSPAFGGDVNLLGKGGAAFAVPAASLADFEARLDVAVRGLGGAVADEASWEVLRIARGLPRFGVEFDTTFYPQEAALEKLAVSFNKGCYLGQEVVYMLENRGHVKRKLVALDIDGDGDAPAAGAVVAAASGEAIGDVKSAVRGPVDGKLAAIAMVKWAHAKPGTELSVDGLRARVAAR